MFQKLLILAVIVYLSYTSWTHFAQEKFEIATVSKVISGDTIELEDGRLLRYSGVTAPDEYDCFAEESKKINETYVLGKEVIIKANSEKYDRQGRELVYVFLDDDDEEPTFINLKMILGGAAKMDSDTVNKKYLLELVKAAGIAHENIRGLWRKCSPLPQFGCSIKGDVDKDGNKTYHLSNFNEYENIIMNLGAGDQWFCKEADALAAGFIKAAQ